MAEREVRSVAYQLKTARFPAYRDLNGFDFASSEINEPLVQQLHRCDFLNDANNIVLVGGPGTGKTHIATAIGVQAIEHHHKRVRFFSTVELVNALEQEKALVNAGLILRKDSPNGKRYARKGRDGDITEAFGFSLAPLLIRAEEFEAVAEQVRGEARALKLMRERITLHRRDIAKLIDAAQEEGLAGNWAALFVRFRALVDALPRRAPLIELETIVKQFADLHDDIDNLLNNHIKTENMNGNDIQNERQHSNSKPESIFEFEPALEKINSEKPEPARSWPLGFVLKACPDIADYAIGSIGSWREMMMTAAQVRSYLGISPSAYEDALDVLRQENTATVIACILQRSQHIQSAGGYLRALTEKARVGEFSVGPMLMVGIKSNSTNFKRT